MSRRGSAAARAATAEPRRKSIHWTRHRATRTGGEQDPGVGTRADGIGVAPPYEVERTPYGSGAAEKVIREAIALYKELQ